MKALRNVTMALGMGLCCAVVWAQGAVQPVPVQPQAAQPAEDPVLIRLGAQEVFRYSDVQAYGRRRADLVPLLKSQTGFPMVVQEMAMTRALVLEGERLQVPRGSSPEPGVDTRLDDLYALGVYRKIAGDCAEPKTEADARRFYDENPQAFHLPVQLQLRRVVLPADATIDGFSADMWLGLQARAAAMGSARFEALVERARQAAPNLRQGDLGWVLLEGEQPLMKALRTAKAGEMVGPVRDGDYWYLLQVQARREAQQLPWESVRHQAAWRAVQYCRETQRERVKTSLFQRYGVQIDDKALRALGATGN